MSGQYVLKVRGNQALVGTHEECVNLLFERYCWVPMKIFEAVVRPEILPVAQTKTGRWNG